MFRCWVQINMRGLKNIPSLKFWYIRGGRKSASYLMLMWHLIQLYFVAAQTRTTASLATKEMGACIQSTIELCLLCVYECIYFMRLHLVDYSVAQRTKDGDFSSACTKLFWQNARREKASFFCILRKHHQGDVVIVRATMMICGIAAHAIYCRIILKICYTIYYIPVFEVPGVRSFYF